MRLELVEKAPRTGANVTQEIEQLAQRALKLGLEVKVRKTMFTETDRAVFTRDIWEARAEHPPGVLEYCDLTLDEASALLHGIHCGRLSEPVRGKVI